MKILIVDDTPANLAAAKQASLQFPEHEFVLAETAVEAFTLLPEVDCLITDCLLPLGESSETAIYLRSLYEEIYSKCKTVDGASMADYVAPGCFNDYLEWLSYTFSGKEFYGLGDINAKYVFAEEDILPYGVALMTSALTNRMPCVIVTDMHRHGGWCGFGVMLPLHSHLTAREIYFDGEDSKLYIGSEILTRNISKKTGQLTQSKGLKERVESWELAICHLLLQKPEDLIPKPELIPNKEEEINRLA